MLQYFDTHLTTLHKDNARTNYTFIEATLINYEFNLKVIVDVTMLSKYSIAQGVPYYHLDSHT